MYCESRFVNKVFDFCALLFTKCLFAAIKYRENRFTQANVFTQKSYILAQNLLVIRAGYRLLPYFYIHVQEKSHP